MKSTVKRKRQGNSWLVKGFIAIGHTYLTIGQPGSCKSWISESLAVDVATGSPYLGKFAAAKGSVILIDQDTPTSVLDKRIRKLCRHRNVSPGKIPLRVYSMKGFRLDSRHDVSELIKEIKQLEPPVLVVIDTLQSVAGEWNLNRTDQAGKLSMALNDIRNAGATVFIVHHMSSKIEDAKGIVLGEGSLMSRAMGNTTIVAKCDTLVGICQLFKQPDKITFALRIVERRTELAVPERFAVELVKSGPGSIALAYQKDIPSLPTSNAARLSMLFIGSPKDRFTVRQVSGKTGEVLSMRETRAALRELEGAGVLVMGRARHNQYKYGLGKNFRAMNTSYAEALRAESGKKKR